MLASGRGRMETNVLSSTYESTPYLLLEYMISHLQDLIPL